jgi:hypothetical protein
MPRSPKTLLALAAAPLVAGALGVLAGCDELPRDPQETTEQVSGAVLRVGWVAGAEPSATERAAVAGVAERLGASVQAVEGPVHRLVAELQEGRLHLLGGALPEKTPFATEVGLTKQVGTVVLRGNAEPAVMAIRSGENRFLLLVNEAIALAKQ